MKKKWIWAAVAALVLAAVFLTVKGVYERERPAVVENILLQRYTEWDYENTVVEEIPLRLELTVRKRLFHSGITVSGKAFLGSDVSLPVDLPEDALKLSGEVNALLHSGVALRAQSDNGFLYGTANPGKLLITSRVMDLPAGEYPPKLRLELCIEVLAPDYNIIRGETLYDQVTLSFLIDEENPTDTGAAELTSYANRYLCNLTPLRAALAAVCE